MQGRGARRFLDWPRMPVTVALLTERGPGGGPGPEYTVPDTSFASLALFRSSLGLFLLQATTWGMRREEGFEPAVQGASRRSGRRDLGQECWGRGVGGLEKNWVVNGRDSGIVAGRGPSLASVTRFWLPLSPVFLPSLLPPRSEALRLGPGTDECLAFCHLNLVTPTLLSPPSQPSPQGSLQCPVLLGY